ncbi:MAG: hypothetical protein GY944_05700 [bacterium]|nr:hypothetical protein [bacterium]MCP5040504.1 hypothetical protein [bacterium]
MTAREIMKDFGNLLVGPALWLALLLLVASTKAHGGFGGEPELGPLDREPGLASHAILSPGDRLSIH